MRLPFPGPVPPEPSKPSKALKAGKAGEAGKPSDVSDAAGEVSGTPSDHPGGGGGGGGSGRGVMSVSQLAAMIDNTLRTGMAQSLRVSGEISNFSNRQHWYFAIKDAESILNCVMFAFKVKSAGFVPVNGQQVIVSGRVEYYKPQGRVSFYVEKIEPAGAGALEMAYRKLVGEIRELGWMDIDRKRELPTFPRKIAVVTSKNGAALQDVLNTAAKRCGAVEICLIDTLVQGPGAAPLIAAAIDFVSAHHQRLGIEALIVTRGGGSMEDLWAFNEKVVAQSIVRCTVPVVAAIGHETDTTIAELVADERCATPTQAAMRLTPDVAALSEQTESLAGRLLQGARRTAIDARRHIERLSKDATNAASTLVQGAARRAEQRGARLDRLKPATLNAARQATLARLEQRLTNAPQRGLQARRSELDSLSVELAGAVGQLRARRSEAIATLTRQLSLIGPQAVLLRGYTLTYRARDNRLVTAPTDVVGGDVVVTKTADGTFESTVGVDGELARRREAIPAARADEPASTPLVAKSSAVIFKPKPAKKSPPGESGTPSLFG